MLVSFFSLIHLRLKDYLRIIGGFEMILISLRYHLGVDSHVEVRYYWSTKCLEAFILRCFDLSVEISV